MREIGRTRQPGARGSCGEATTERPVEMTGAPPLCCQARSSARASSAQSPRTRRRSARPSRLPASPSPGWSPSPSRLEQVDTLMPDLTAPLGGVGGVGEPPPGPPLEAGPETPPRARAGGGHDRRRRRGRGVSTTVFRHRKQRACRSGWSGPRSRCSCCASGVEPRRGPRVRCGFCSRDSPSRACRQRRGVRVVERALAQVWCGWRTWESPQETISTQ